MARMTFPQDRATFVYQAPNQPILSPPRTGLELYRESAGGERADVCWLDGTPIVSAQVYTGHDGLIPEFLGPDDGTLVLYAQAIGTTDRYALEARFSDAITLLASEAQADSGRALVGGFGPPGPSAGIVGGFYLDRTDRQLWGPKLDADSWPDAPIELDAGVPELPPLSFRYDIGMPTTEAIIDHPLGFIPGVTFTDTEGEVVLCDVSYPTPSRVVVSFGIPTTGTVHLS